MQVSIQFNPAVDDHNELSALVAAIYNVGIIKANTLQVGNVHVAAQATAPTMAAANVSPPSQASALAQAGSPNVSTPLTAPTVADISEAVTTDQDADAASLDKDGVPWDARIHSSSRKVNADGRWSKRKGVQPLEHQQITQELQNLMASQVGHIPPPAGLPAGGVLGNPVNVPHQEAIPVPGQPDAFVAAPIAMGNAQPQPAAIATVAATSIPNQTSAPAIAPVEQAVPAPNTTVAPMPVMAPVQMAAPAPALVPQTYVELAQWLARQMAPNGKLTPEHVEHFCRLGGLVNGQGQGDFQLLQHRADLVQWLYDAFTMQIAAL